MRKNVGLFFLGVFFIVFLSRPVSAQIIPLESVTPSPIPTPKQIEYPLPYPGILPGQPLYVVKLLRDKIVEVFTLNPIKKTEFYLLQADKRLSSAIILFDKGEEQNGETTLSKGQNYLEKAISEEHKAKNTPGNLLELSRKIEQSSKKQTQEVERLFKKSKGEIRSKLKGDLERAKMLQKRAEEFSP